MEKSHKTYWRTTILVIIFLILLAYIGFTLILPTSEPNSEENDRMTQVDVEITENDEPDSDETQIADTTQEQESKKPEHEFSTIALPDFSDEITYAEETLPSLQNIQTTSNRKKLPPRQQFLTRDEAEILNQLDSSPEAEVVSAEHQSNQQMSQSPIAITENYPQLDSSIDYNGYVSVIVRIGTDGAVKETKIIQSSAQTIVDNIAMNSARKWTFKPALDQDGEPMECDKIIIFNFNEVE